VDLHSQLGEDVAPVQVAQVVTQTDAFQPEPPPPAFKVQKSGIDASTQVYDGDLFHFDIEVRPIVNVIADKIMEQSLMEVQEEMELAEMGKFKQKWFRRQKEEMDSWKALVEQERAFYRETKELMAQESKRVDRETDLLRKLQVLALAEQAGSRTQVHQAFADLAALQAFTVPDAACVENEVFPYLLEKANEDITRMIDANSVVDGLLFHVVQNTGLLHAEARSTNITKMAQKQANEKEEREIMKGNIRIYVDQGEGKGKLPIGPVRISTDEVPDDVHDSIMMWLQENHPSVADNNPYGVELLIGDMPMTETKQLFTARAGQITMRAKEPPPPPTPPEEPPPEAEEVGA
jgi:hypothetical protein